MLSPSTLLYSLTGCLLHSTGVSAGVGIKIPIIIDATTVFTVAFSFLVIFSILGGFQFLGAFVKVCGVKEELPPDVSPIKYDTGRLYHWLTFITVSMWWAQLIIRTVYVQDVFMRNPKRNFPDTAYIARYSLDVLADFFMAASMFQLIHYRRKIHNSVVAPFSALKKTFDVVLLVVHLAIICYTTAFQCLSIADPSSETKYLNWLTSYYVYTGIYVLMVLNVNSTSVTATDTLKDACIKDEPFGHAAVVPGMMLFHALFKIIMAILYSQWRNPKIDYDILRIFDVLVLGSTYLVAIFGLLLASSISTEDNKRLKELKKLKKLEDTPAEERNEPK